MTAHSNIARRQSSPTTARLLDSAKGLPAAKHASSLRLLRTAYTGYCIRVRRSSDNTTLDIGFVAGVVDTAAIATFCGASDGFVAIAYDQSGNGLNAVYPSTASQERIYIGGTSFTPSTTDSTNQATAHNSFKTGYVTAAGQVIRYDQGSDIVSEGLAYEMKFAVINNDQTTFNLVRNWANANVKRSLSASGRTTYLTCWAWKAHPSGTGATIDDWNFASDAEFDRYIAMEGAIARGWDTDGSLLAELNALVVDLTNMMLVDGAYAIQVTDEYQMGAGSSGGHHTVSGGVVAEINPSYFRPVAYHMLKNRTGNTLWDKALVGCYYLLGKATDNSGTLSTTSGLPPDWCYYDTSTHDVGALTSGTQGWTYTRSTGYAYDAFRTLYSVYADYKYYGTAAALTYLSGALKTYFTSQWSSNGSIAAELNHDGSIANNYQKNFFTGAARLAMIANDPTNTTAAAIKTAHLASSTALLVSNGTYSFFQTDPGGTTSSYFGDSWMQFYVAMDSGQYAKTLTGYIGSGALETFGANSKPAARSLGATYGSSTQPFTAYAGSIATASFVGGFGSGAAPIAPQMVALHPSNTSLTTSDATGAVLVGRKDTLSSAKAETLTDDFSTQNGSKWTGFGTGCLVTGGQLQITPASPYIGLTSLSKYDLTESHYTLQLVTRANAGNNTIENQMLITVDTSNQVGFIVAGSQLTMRHRVAGSNSDTGITYNATNHKYLRIRNASGTTYWETSPDNTTWTTQRSLAETLTLTSINMQIICGYYGTEPTITTAVWDNVNTVVTSAASNNWAITRAGVYEAYYTGVYAGDNTIFSSLNAGTYVLAVDGVAASGVDAATALSVGSIGFGMSSPTQFANAQDCYWQERIVWLTSLTSAQQSTLLTSQQAYYGTTAVTGGSGGGNGSTGGGGGGGTGRYNLEANGYTLGAQENFVGTTRPSGLSTYDYGVMTSSAGAWMDYMVSVGPSATGDGTNCLKIGIQYSSTLVNGYHVVGGVATMDDTSTFMKKGGAWEYRIRSDANQGTGFADLMWPADPPNWPTKGEIDIREIYSNSSGVSNYQKGESNFHLDTVQNSGRHLQCPSSTTHSIAGDVSVGNYQIDWTQWHIVQLIWNPVTTYIGVYIDGILKGYTTDPSYVPNNGSGNAVPMRPTFQTEHYGATDASVSSTIRYTEVDYIKYYALP